MIQTKQTILILITLFLFACKQENTDAPSTSQATCSTTADVAAGKQALTDLVSALDAAYKADDEAAFQKCLSKDILVYGTDPSEVWNYKVFQNHLRDIKTHGVPKLHLVKLNEILMDADGNGGCMIRELSWDGLFDNTIREVIYCVKEGNEWKVKSIVLGHLLPNKRKGKNNTEDK